MGKRQLPKVSEGHLTPIVAILSILYLFLISVGPMIINKSTHHQPSPSQAHKESFLRVHRNGEGEVMPPPFVEFDLTGDESAAEAVTYFMEHCTGNTVKDDSPKNSHLWNGIEFLNDAKCSKLAEHPVVLNAARKVMGLDQDAPVYLFGMRKIKKVAGDLHRLHTDLDLATPECRPNNGAILWIMIKNECPDEVSPLTFVSGSHVLANTAHDELASRGCWSTPFQKLPCDVNQVISDVHHQHKNVFPKSGPTQAMTGVSFPSTAWHMTNDKCEREVVLIKFAGTISCARSLEAKFPSSEIGEFNYYPERMPFVRIGPGGPRKDEIDPLDYLHMQPSEDDDERCYQMKQDFARGE